MLVKKVDEAGPAHTRVQVGERLISINGVVVDDTPIEEVIALAEGPQATIENEQEAIQTWVTMEFENQSANNPSSRFHSESLLRRLRPPGAATGDENGNKIGAAFSWIKSRILQQDQNKKGKPPKTPRTPRTPRAQQTPRTPRTPPRTPRDPLPSQIANKNEAIVIKTMPVPQAVFVPKLPLRNVTSETNDRSNSAANDRHAVGTPRSGILKAQKTPRSNAPSTPRGRQTTPRSHISRAASSTRSGRSTSRGRSTARSMSRARSRSASRVSTVSDVAWQAIDVLDAMCKDTPRGREARESPPIGFVKIQVIQALDVPITDTFALPSTYCRVTLAEQTFRSQKIENSVAPRFAKSCRLLLRQGDMPDKIKISVWYWRFLGKDECIGEVWMPVSSLFEFPETTPGSGTREKEERYVVRQGEGMRRACTVHLKMTVETLRFSDSETDSEDEDDDDKNSEVREAAYA